MSKTNMWPQLNVDPDGPEEILVEQIEGLSAMTSGKLAAQLSKRVGPIILKRTEIDFIVNAPSIDTSYVLFTVTHPVDRLYPATIHHDELASAGEFPMLGNDVDFRRALSRVLSSEDVKTTLTALLAAVKQQSRKT